MIERHSSELRAAPDTLDRPLEWPDRAACLGLDPELFFPVQSAPEFAEPAKTVCRRCEVVRDCLGYGLTYEVDGVWGATTKAERDQLRAKHRLTPHPVLTPQLGDNVVADVARLQGGYSALDIARELRIPLNTVHHYQWLVRRQQHLTTVTGASDDRDQ